jgi:hypothetical protein
MDFIYQLFTNFNNANSLYKTIIIIVFLFEKLSASLYFERLFTNIILYNQLVQKFGGMKSCQLRGISIKTLWASN